MIIGKEKAGTSVVRINSIAVALYIIRKIKKTTNKTVFQNLNKKRKKPSVLDTKSIHSKTSTHSRQKSTKKLTN
jgi:hypothetical protein